MAKGREVEGKALRKKREGKLTRREGSWSDSERGGGDSRGAGSERRESSGLLARLSKRVKSERKAKAEGDSQKTLMKSFVRLSARSPSERTFG
jgi:hypothetical protein